MKWDGPPVDPLTSSTTNSKNMMMIPVSGPSGVSTYAYDGLGNRYQQTVNGATTTYTLDLASGLTQVLADGYHILAP
jgi:YD repeat-containing protein